MIMLESKSEAENERECGEKKAKAKNIGRCDDHAM